MEGDGRGTKLTCGTAGPTARDALPSPPLATASRRRELRWNGSGCSSPAAAGATGPPPQPQLPQARSCSWGCLRGLPHALLDGSPRKKRQENGRGPSCQVGGSDGPDLGPSKALDTPQESHEETFVSFIASPPSHAVHPVQTEKAFCAAFPMAVGRCMRKLHAIL